MRSLGRQLTWRFERLEVEREGSERKGDRDKKVGSEGKVSVRVRYQKS